MVNLSVSSNAAGIERSFVDVTALYAGIPQERTRSKSDKVFVVWAGSDGVRGKAEKGHAAREAATVSKELLALGNVISAATAESWKHVPYRDSLLTRVLQASKY